MSLILDALRKMEQDRKNRRGAALDIRPEVLRYRAAAKPQRTVPYLPVALGLLLLALGIGAGFFLKGNHGATELRENASVTREIVAVAPVSPIVETPVMALPAPQPVSVPVAVAPVVPVAPTPVRQPVAAVIPSRPQAVTPRMKNPRRETAAVTQTAPADLTVSGIAWQDERRMRRAVLNGTLVGEGAEIAGARVVEIREDKVRLSRGGQVFDVPLSSGFSPR